jgi:hypothetical protein
MKFQFERHRRTILTMNKTTVAQIIRTNIPAIMESKGDTIAITSSFLFPARSQTHLSPPDFEWPCFVQEFVL